MQGFPLLSFLTWLPIAGGIVVLLFGDRGIQAGRCVALATAVVALLASIPLYTGFDASTSASSSSSGCPGSPRCIRPTTWASTASRCR